jgi:hypothetical protein
MKRQIFVKATRDGRAFFQTPHVNSDFSEFENLMLKFGDFPYFVTISDPPSNLQDLEEDKLLDIIDEVESAAQNFFGRNYIIKDFVFTEDFDGGPRESY